MQRINSGFPIMNKKNRELNHNTDHELFDVKNSLANGLIIGISIIGLPALILSIVTSSFSGNFPFVSLISYFIILLMVVFLKKLNFRLKAWGAILFGFTIGTTGLISEGLLSDGFLYYLTISVLSALIIGTKTGFSMLIITFTSSFVIAWLFHKDIILYNFDLYNYSRSFPVWSAIILVTTFFTGLILIITKRFNNYLFDTIKKLINAKKDLELEIEHNRDMKSSLSKSEKKFKHVFDTIEDAIVIFDDDYKIIDANTAFFQLTGFHKDQIEKITFADFIDDFEKIKKNHFNPEQNDNFPYKNEVNIIFEQNHIPVEFSIIPFTEINENYKLCVIRDVREKKIIEKQILNAIVQTEEKERTRISRDLHDCLGPLLSAVKLYSTSLSSSEISPKYQDLSSKITDMMDEAIKTVKEVSNNLSSHILKHFGLYDAINSFSEKIQKTYPVSFDVEFAPELKISEEIQITMYRVIVELINNTVKYATAKKITIRAGTKNNNLVFIYKDDGVGFDFEEVMRNKKGMGLYNIHSRIKSLGGYINIISTKEKGTTAMIVI